MITATKVLMVMAGAQAAAAVGAEAGGLSHLASGGLSVGALLSAYAAFRVNSEKTKRNEKDIEKVTGALETLGRDMRAGFTEMRGEIREDLREHREQTRETVQQLVDVINNRAQTIRAGEER